MTDCKKCEHYKKCKPVMTTASWRTPNCSGFSRKDQFAKVVTYSTDGGIENISSEEADLRIIKSVLKINFVLRDRLGITLKEDSAIEMFLEFIEKIGKFNENKA